MLNNEINPGRRRRPLEAGSICSRRQSVTKKGEGKKSAFGSSVDLPGLSRYVILSFDYSTIWRTLTPLRISGLVGCKPVPTLCSFRSPFFVCPPSVQMTVL